MPRCPSCGGESFRVEGERDCAVLACATCGCAIGESIGPRIDELARELQGLREELGRLRQAVNFLNQRVR